MFLKKKINQSPDSAPKKSFLLSIFLFLVIIVAYFCASYLRHVENPQDKIMPSFSQLIDGVQFALTPNLAGEIPLLIDTYTSLQILIISIFIVSILSLVLGIGMGFFRFLDTLLHPFISYFGKIPPLALLPILFIISGIGDGTKILLIVIGITPVITSEIYLKVKALPKEHLIKAITLGSTRLDIIRRVILPQIMPSAINCVRINLLNAWIFLIAAESIAAQAGLGYRIFVVRRYLALDIIIPYVLWIAFLSFLIDWLLRIFIKHRYPWFNKQ